MGACSQDDIVLAQWAVSDTCSDPTGSSSHSHPSLTPTANLPTSSSRIPATPLTRSSSSTTTTTSPAGKPTQPSGGISIGAKAGIGAGAAAGGLLLIGIGALLFWYGRRSAIQKQKLKEMETEAPGKAELGDGTSRHREMEGTPISGAGELPAQDERAELEALRGRGNAAVEMP